MGLLSFLKGLFNKQVETPKIEAFTVITPDPVVVDNETTQEQIVVEEPKIVKKKKEIVKKEVKEAPKAVKQKTQKTKK